MHLHAVPIASPRLCVYCDCREYPATNNQSEYSGLLGGLRMAQHFGIKRLLVQVRARLPRLSGLLSILI